MLKTAVIVSGVLGGIAWLFPSLVIVGFFLLVVPGVILSLAPTVFCYLALALLIRTLLPFEASAVTTILSLAASGAIGWAVMQPFHRSEVARFEAAIKPAVPTPDGFNLSGVVRVEGYRTSDYGNAGREGCNSLCLLILDQPGVEAVINVTQKKGKDPVATAYRLGQGQPGVRSQPLKASPILQHFNNRANGIKGWEQLKAQQEQLDASWAQRTAGDEPLMAAPATPDDAPDFTISISSKERPYEEPRYHHIEIRNHAGDLVGRIGVTEHWVPGPLFSLDFVSGGADSGFSNARFRVARQIKREGGRLDTFNTTKAIIELAGLEAPQIDDQAGEDLREKVQEALANPNATPEQLGLADLWLSANSHGLAQDDMALAGAILEDLRFPISHDRLTGALLGNRELAPLRRGLVQRVIVQSDDDDIDRKKTQSVFVGLLAKMPEGTFEHPTASERMLWEMSSTQPTLTPFLKRMADQGEAAVPQMLKVIDDRLSATWNQRQWPYGALANAFQDMGPVAKAAIPRINALMGRDDSPLTNSSKDVDQWCFALARMGLPVDDIAFPRRFSEDTVARYREAVRQRMARYEEQQAKAEGSR